MTMTSLYRISVKTVQDELLQEMQLRKQNVCEANNTEVKLILPENKMTNLTIAIDYDETLSLQPGMWKEIVPLFKQWGFKVYIVTYRHDDGYGNGGWGFPVNNSDMQWAIDICDHVVFTGAKSKKETCAKLGIFPHIWIDDTPEAIVFSGCHDWHLRDMITQINKTGRIPS